MAKLKEKEGLEFPVLVDPGCEAIKSWGILNEGSGKIPHPTAAIVDAEGLVRFARVDTDYKVRSHVEELLSALRELD